MKIVIGDFMRPLKIMVSVLILWSLNSMIVGCGTVRIRSTPPEAEVWLVQPGKEEPKLMGKTPFTADIRELGDAVNNGTIALTLKKRGYFPKQYIVPNLASADLEIESNMSPNLHSNFQEINRIVGLLFKGQRFIKQKRFDDALKSADEIKVMNENIAAAYHISGTVFYLQNKLKKSRFEWIRAVELDPSSVEALNMLSHIEKKTGFKEETKNK
jgi:hypothetical protein